jgi:co-chaperonin GroES (HSP10)
MRAVGSFIIVTNQETYQKNDLGLIISESVDQNVRYLVGKVITTGDEVKEINVGSFVYYDKVAGSPIRINGEKFIAIRERDVVITVDEPISSI